MPPSPRLSAPAGEALHVGALSDIASRYDLILCDVWGVLHDGLAALPAAAEALAAYRQGGASASSSKAISASGRTPSTRS